MADFFDEFETAWETVGLSPISATPVVDPIPLYRGDRNDPAVWGNKPPFAAYDLVSDVELHRSTKSDMRTRLIEIDFYHNTMGQAFATMLAAKKQMTTRQNGALFWQLLAPDDENVLDMKIFQMSEFNDDKKKVASGMWVAILILKFTLSWVRN